MNKSVYDSSLVPQPTLEQAAQQWRIARPLLFVKQVRQQAMEADNARAGPSKPTSNKRQRSDSDSPVTQSEAVLNGTQKEGVRRSSRTTSSRRPVAVEVSSDMESEDETKLTSENGDDTYDDQPNGSSRFSKDYRKLAADDLQACPICKHTFTLRMLNVHLDKMTCSEHDPPPSAQERGLPSSGTASNHPSGGVASSSSQGGVSWFKKSGAKVRNGSDVPLATPRKKLVRLNYDMAKPADLKRALDEWRLSTSGERKRLIERHRRWVNIFNANLDASEKMRKTEATLRQELQVWERSQDDILRNSAASSVSERKVKTWTTDHKDEFARLAAQARQSHMRDRSKHDQEEGKTDSKTEDELHDEEQPPQDLVTSDLSQNTIDA
jgi:E3 ubiquitin-protein ligase RAD18